MRSGPSAALFLIGYLPDRLPRKKHFTRALLPSLLADGGLLRSRETSDTGGSRDNRRPNSHVEPDEQKPIGVPLHRLPRRSSPSSAPFPSLTPPSPPV